STPCPNEYRRASPTAWETGDDWQTARTVLWNPVPAGRGHRIRRRAGADRDGRFHRDAPACEWGQGRITAVRGARGRHFGVAIRFSGFHRGACNGDCRYDDL